MLKKVKNENARRFRVAAVAQAIGYSEGTISGYFSTMGIPTRGGITIQQIERLLQDESVGKRAGNLAKEKNEVLKALEAIGWVDVPEMMT